MKTRIPYSQLKKLASHLEESTANLSAILGNKRGIGKKKALDYEKKGKAAGYPFTASEWIFSPEKIKEQLSERSLQK